MPDSRPPNLDDGGDHPEVDRSNALRPGHERIDERHDDRDEGPAGDRRYPNFLIRRAIVVGVVVVVIAGVAVFAGRLLGGGDSSAGTGLGKADWNTVVAVDDKTGTVVLTDEKGEETNRLSLGLRSLTATDLSNRTLVAVSDEVVAVVRLDATAKIEPSAITKIDMASATSLLRPSGTNQTIVAGSPGGDRAVLVHGPTGEVIDTDEFDTVPGAKYDLSLTRADSSGRNILLTDNGNFQSVLFSFDRDDPSFFPGLALTIDDETVVTFQNVGANANIAVFDHEGEPGVSVQTESVRAGMIAGDDVILIGVDGEVLSMSLGNGDITELSSLNIGTVRSGHVALRGDRLIVIGADGTAIVDDKGTILVELPAATPTTTGIDVGAPRRDSCLVVERITDGDISVIDLDDGAVRAEAVADREVLLPQDGCSPVVITASGYLTIDDDGAQTNSLDADVVAISPDGGTLAAERSNRIVLVPRNVEASGTGDAEQDDPIDIGRSGRMLYFAEL